MIFAFPVFPKYPVGLIHASTEKFPAIDKLRCAEETYCPLPLNVPADVPYLPEDVQPNVPLKSFNPNASFTVLPVFSFKCHNEIGRICTGEPLKLSYPFSDAP